MTSWFGVSVFMAACLGLAAPASAADAGALAKFFGARTAARAMRLSPEGTQVSYIAPNGARGAAIMVANIGTSEAKVAFSVTDNAMTPRWCHWKTETRLLCLFYGTSKTGSLTVDFTRLAAFNNDGTKLLIVDKYGGVVIDWLPEDPDNILMQFNGAAKVNINTGKSVWAADGKGGLATDNHGTVRFMDTVEFKDGYASDKVHYFYRQKGRKDWIAAGSAKLSGYGELEYLGFDESGDNLLALRPLDGRQALFSIAADGSGAQTLLFAHNQVDIDGVLRIGKFERPVAATYTLDEDAYEFFDPQLKKLTAALSAALPGKPSVVVYDESWDGKTKLIFAGSDSNPGRFMLFNTATRQLGELAALRPELDGLQFASVTPVHFKAQDGSEVPGFLTLPPGRGAKHLPTIIMPHGGPTARDSRGFDWLAQYFAQLGYAVLQPNFRGSGGYGEAWYNRNGFQSWATAMGDINDSARWLAAQGIADPKRIAIFGWSYGGYAALQANVLDPALYRAAIAVAPVTNLVALKARTNRYSNGELVAKMVGTGPHVSAGSPAYNAERIKVPVLLFHGDRDLNVDISQSRSMDSALTSAGVQHALIVYAGLDHQLEDSGVRADMLKRSADWLAAAMGPPQ